MAQILDKQGLQHYANKMCNADNRKVGSKSLPAALNEIDTAIDGFKTLFESEYGSALDMKLENNENVFSVGTGIDIDKKDDVENSFTDIELSGNSLVNLSATKQLLNQTSAHYSDVYLCESSRLKANTSYRLEYDFECNIDFTFSKCYLGYSTSKGSMIAESSVKFDAKKGKNILNFTLTQSELDIVINNNFKYFMVRVFIDSDKKEKTYSTKNVMLLEGDWTNKPIPQYFEGLKSVGEKEDGNHKISILSRGKNLFDTNLLYGAEILSKDLSSFIFQGWASHSISNSDVKKLFKPNTTYTIKAKAKIIKKVGTVPVFDYDVGGMFYHAEMTPNHFGRFQSKTMYNLGDEAILETTFTTPNCLDKYKLRLYSNRYADENVAQYDIVEFSEIQLEESTTSSEFESYKSDKKEISLNEPLRGLPNGIKDTIEKVNGEWKIVRRCGEVVLDGSEYWSKYTPNETSSCFGHVIDDIATKYQYGLVCDRFASAKDYYPNSVTDEGINQHGNKVLLIRINHSRLSSQDVAGFKQWLSQNPTKVIYELETPIIENISPVTLQCWKNGTISIDEVLPVESTHTVALNKSAQIQKNIEELSILKNRIETLEKQYNNSTLNQAYELELLRLDMQLDNII